MAIIEAWNATPTHDWSPAIGTALKSGYRWLDVYCAGCRQVKPIDLATIDIHPQACLTSLILLLRCRQCWRPRAVAEAHRVIEIPARYGCGLEMKVTVQPTTGIASTTEIEMAKNDLISRIKEIDAERTKLMDAAKKEALARAQQAVADLNALSFAYSLGETQRRKSAGQIQTEKPCPICKFKTVPPHDGRRHRFSAKAKKRPFSARELANLGLRRV
jgi:hypothetical protein